MSNAGKIFVEDVKDFKQDRIINEVVKKVKNIYPLTNHEFCIVVDTAELSCQAIAKEIFIEFEKSSIGLIETPHKKDCSCNYCFALSWIKHDLKRIKRKFLREKMEHCFVLDGYQEYDGYLYPILKCRRCNLRILAEDVDDERCVNPICESKEAKQ